MNLSIRVQNRRFTCLTNAFNNELDNHIHALALYFAFYNFCRIHKSLPGTPAMAASSALFRTATCYFFIRLPKRLIADGIYLRGW